MMMTMDSCILFRAFVVCKPVTLMACGRVQFLVLDMVVSL
jgi:hypothetical protein